MKRQVLVITALVLAFGCGSCKDDSKASLEKKVADLEKKVADQESTLKKRKNEVATLATVVYSSAQARMLEDPLANFFSSPEFWQNTYPVDPSAGCHKGCADNFQAALKVCQSRPVSEQQKCVDDNYKFLVGCTQACDQGP